MRTAIVVLRASIAPIILGIISILLISSMHGCKEVDIVQAVELEETKIATLEDLNRELELDIWCDLKKISELKEEEESKQYLITFRRK